MGHCLVSKRWIVAYMGFMGAVALYLMRVNASMAVVCMTTDLPADTTDNYTTRLATYEYQEFMEHLDVHCPKNVESEIPSGNHGIKNGTLDVNSTTLKKFSWSRQMRGWVLSSFYIGYIPMQLPSALLARRFGAKKILLAGGTLDTIATFLSPVAARTSVYLLMIMQVVKGLGHAPYQSCMYHLWSTWAPTFERTKLSAFCMSGMFACLWLLMWQLLVFDNPEVHPKISNKEKDYILKSTGVHKEHTRNLKVPWLTMAKSPALWAIIIADFSFSWVFYLFLTTLPQYMKDILRFDIKTNGLFMAMPLITMLISSNVFSFTFDWLRSRHILSTANVRRLADTFAIFLPAILLIGIGYMDCTQYIGVVILLCLASGFGGANRSGPLANTIDIAPRYAGVMNGITNTASNIAGFIVPALVAAMTPTGLPSEWRKVFFTSAGVQVFGWLVFMICCRGEAQPWAQADSNKQNLKQDSTELLPSNDGVPPENSGKDFKV